MNLRIDNVWGSWTPCSACKPNFGKRTRQGHCLLRKIQYNKPITLPKRLTSDMKNLFAADVMVEVVTDLNEIFSKSPFTYEGIRCWSLPILLAGVRGGRNPPCLNWLKIPKLRGITWELERYLGEMVQKRSDLTSGCLMWFHNLFHSQFGPASEPEIRADNPYYPFQPWANYKPDWKILTGAASHWLVEDHNDWMETVLRVLKLSLNTKSLPVCGSAGYYIDYEECMETRCVSG